MIVLEATQATKRSNMSIRLYASICGEGEFAARLTADNFNILMRNGPQKELIERLEKIVEDINNFNKSLESKYYLPFSEGVYIIDDPALNLITIQDRANVARKNSKEALHISRLSSCMFYTDLQPVRMVRGTEIDNRMESALENGSLLYIFSQRWNCRIIPLREQKRWDGGRIQNWA